MLLQIFAQVLSHMEGVSTATSIQSLGELASMSTKARSWHNKVVSKVAHVESIVFIFFEF